MHTHALPHLGALPRYWLYGYLFELAAFSQHSWFQRIRGMSTIQPACPVQGILFPVPTSLTPPNYR